MTYIHDRAGLPQEGLFGLRRSVVLRTVWCMLPIGPHSDPDEVLFKRAPKSVKALNLVARREARAKDRYAWAIAHPNNPKVYGKPLTKPPTT